MNPSITSNNILKNKWAKWAIGTLVLSTLATIFAPIINETYFDSKCNFLKIIVPIISGVASIITFLCGCMAHQKQNKLIEDVHDLLFNKSKNLAEAISVDKSGCDAYVKLVLYAMYQSYQHPRTPVYYDKIDTKKPILIRFIIESIFATVKSDRIMGTIGDDGAIIMTEFDTKKEITQTISDGRILINQYKHFDTCKIVKQSVRRINKCCGIEENYSA